MAGTTTIAIDWSGAKKPSGKIWLAKAHDRNLASLRPAKSRDEAIEWLLEQFKLFPNAVAGLDFAFSMPRWFVEKHGATGAINFWQIVKERGEVWLEECEHPFWGRPNRKKAKTVGPEFRRTEVDVAGGSVRPKSVFQVGGGGHVGTGSIRGMPFLVRLRDAGVAVWPFDGCSRPMAVEIYPRLFTGGVNKSKPSARWEYLKCKLPDLAEDHVFKCLDSEDAFDAAVSAVELCRTLNGATRRRDEVSLIEGEIWR